MNIIKNHLKRFWIIYLLIFVIVASGAIGNYLMYGMYKNNNLFDQILASLGIAVYLCILFLIVCLIIFLKRFIVKGFVNDLQKDQEHYMHKLLNLKDEFGDDYLSKEFKDLIILKPMNFHLHIPKRNWLIYQLAETRLALAIAFGINIGGFAIKHRNSPELMRSIDIWFIYHALFDHINNNEGVMTFFEKFRYIILARCIYAKELRDYNGLYSKKYKTKSEKKFIELYDQLYIHGYFAIKQDDMYRIIH